MSREPEKWMLDAAEEWLMPHSIRSGPIDGFIAELAQIIAQHAPAPAAQQDELKAAWERGRDEAAEMCSGAVHSMLNDYNETERGGNYWLDQAAQAIRKLRYSGEAPQPKGEPK